VVAVEQVGEGEPVESRTIVTTTANDLLRLVLDRMPVILAPQGPRDVARPDDAGGAAARAATAAPGRGDGGGTGRELCQQPARRGAGVPGVVTGGRRRSTDELVERLRTARIDDRALDEARRLLAEGTRPAKHVEAGCWQRRSCAP
jgi:hypothetical protein